MDGKRGSRLEFDFIPDLGPRHLDRTFRQFEDPSGGKEYPGNAISAETTIQSHHLLSGVEKQRVELEPHPEGMNAVARTDPHPFTGGETFGAKQSPYSGNERVRLPDRVTQ
jgi:hypothetical protein